MQLCPIPAKNETDAHKGDDVSWHNKPINSCLLNYSASVGQKTSIIFID